MAEDFSGQGTAVEDLPDFSKEGTPWEPPRSKTPEGWLPVGEETQETPEMRAAANRALINIDPRWNIRPPEPTIGGLISHGMEWINRTFPAPAEPMPAPLTPIVPPPSVELTPEQIARKHIKERIQAVEHPVSTGLERSAEKLLTTMATPSGVGAIALTPVAPYVTLPAFSAMGTEGSLDAIRRIQEARQEGDRVKYYEAVGDLAVQAPMIAGPVALARPELVKLPRSLAALRREPTTTLPTEPRLGGVPPPGEVIRAEMPPPETAVTLPTKPPEPPPEPGAAAVPVPTPVQPTGGPSASQVQSPTEIHGNLRPQPIEGAGGLPAAKGGEGIQPQGAGTAAGVLGGGEEAARPEVPLTKEEAALRAAQAQPEGPAGEAQAIAQDIAKAVDAIDVSDIKNFSPVPGLIRLIRRATTDPAMKTAAEQAMQKIGQAAREQGVGLDRLKADMAKELAAVYGADAKEMAEYYFGKEPEKAGEQTKEPWQRTRKDYVETVRQRIKKSSAVDVNATYLAGEQHRLAVEDALREGKPVSAEVLLDYPDLKPSEPPKAIAEKAGEREMVTLYRGEGPPYTAEQLSKLPAHLKANIGEWFTQSLKDAENYAATRGGKITTLRIPKSELEQYRIAELDEFRIPKEVQEKYGSKPAAVPVSEPPIGEGPGAKTAGAPKYPAIQQLTDQLNATPKVGARQGLKLGERIADAWSRRGDLVTKAIGRMVNAGNGLKKTFESLRKASDLDSRLGEYDYAIQYSSSASKRAGEAIERQMPNVTDREAAAILIDSARIAKDPGNPAEVRQVIKDGLDLLPADTPRSVRLAMERALDPSLEIRQFAEQLRQYYGIREQDAMGEGLFSEGLTDYYTHVWKKEENMPSSLRNAIATGRVNTYFQFARQRTLPTLIEGILEGKTPILDPAKVIPFYNFAMDRAIASRAFIKALSDTRASDGRPAVDVRGGAVIQDPVDIDSPVLVTPKSSAKDIADYQSINHPAMQGWKWVTKTPEGRDVLMRGEMVVHPEFHEILARFMDRSRLATSKGIGRALAFGATAKTFKLGLLPSTFHIVHVGTHAAFHWTNPFKWAPIDFEAPATRFAIEKGHLKLAPSPSELSLFQEGVAATGLIRKIPVVGQWAGAFSDWMFHQYIPRLKLNTFENAMARARSPLTSTGRALRAGRLTENDVSARIGDAVNNAFGELNTLFLGKFGRDPKTQRALRMIFLAPDFGEARLRFVTKGMSRYGTEERLALATMFGALYFGARLGNWLSHGNAEADDWKHAFEVKTQDEKGRWHWIGMRSVIGDIAHAIERPGQFLYVRLNPAYSRPTTDLLFGREERTGRKLSWEERAVRAAQAFEPIGLGGLSEPDRTILESLGQSMGLSNRRDIAVSDVERKAHEWMDAHGHKPIVEVIPTDEPSYMKLRMALDIGKTNDAKKVLQGLLKTRTQEQVEAAMMNYLNHPYTGSQELEQQFIASLDKNGRQLYRNAYKEKQNTLMDFARLMRDMNQKKK